MRTPEACARASEQQPGARASAQDAKPELRTPNPNPSPTPDPRPLTPESALTPGPRTPAPETKPRAPHVLTPARLEACYRGIEAARKVTRLYDAPNYGNHFFHGLTCLDLRRSAPMAGEDRGEFDRFLARLVAKLAPIRSGLAPGDSPGPSARKLARSAALVAWRRRRVFGSQARWEMQRVQFLLGEVILERERSPEPLGAERLGRLASELVDGLGMLGHGPRLAECGVLERRLERLLRMHLREENGGADPHFHYAARVSRFEQVLPLERSEAWLSNPLAGRQATERAREASELAVQPTKDWERHASGDFDSWFTDGWMSQRERFLRYTVPGIARRAKMPELRVTRPEDFEAFRRLVAQAFGEDDRGSGSGVRESQSAVSEIAPDARSANPESRTPNPVRALAELLWERLQVFARRAEEEAAALDQILAESRAPTSRGDAPNSEPRTLRTLAAKILGVFYHSYGVFKAARDLTERVKGALYQLLQRHNGPLPEFDELKPEPPDTMREADELVDQLLEWHLQQAMAKRGAANIAEWIDETGKPEPEDRSQKTEERSED